MPTVLDNNEHVPFISARGFVDGEEVEFMSEGKLAVDRYGDNRLQIDIRRLTNGEIRKMTVNKTSQKSLVPAYGPATEAWVGRKARVTTTKMLISGGWKIVAILSPSE